MERHQPQSEAESAYALEVYRTVMRRGDLPDNVKKGFYALLALSGYRFRQPICITSANVSEQLGRTSTSGLRYLSAVIDAGFLHVFKKRDGTRRFAGSNVWAVSLLDPTLEIDQQLRTVEADSQRRLFDDGDDPDAGLGGVGTTAPEGSGGGGGHVLPFKCSRHDGDSTGVDSAGPEAAPSLTTGGSPRVAMPDRPPEAAAELSPTSPQLGPADRPAAELATESPHLARALQTQTLSQTQSEVFEKDLQTSLESGSCGGIAADAAELQRRIERRRADAGVVLRSEPARVAPSPIVAAITAGPSPKRTSLILEWTQLIRREVDDPRMPDEFVHKVASAVVDGDLPEPRVRKVFGRLAKLRAAGTIVNPGGFFYRAMIKSFREEGLDWTTGHKLPD